ncbi:PSF1 [Candida theae]|uniref:DNA replication complex GINS protein PSF1 n=1 Tax=Candida theae TaxID=1198502 RepID=A0AAD5BDD2_9ASCO|nr:PSF1 [Candida theae]KAI5955990.1 PSF1 [Candida theae]
MPIKTKSQMLSVSTQMQWSREESKVSDLCKMYGDQANKLVADAKRFSNLPSVPIYQAELVKDIVKEINDLNRDAEYLSTVGDNLRDNQDEGSPTQKEEDYKINQCQTFVTHLSMRRNKRCLLAYEKLRSDKLIEFAWLNIDPAESVDQSASSTTGTSSSSTASLPNSRALLPQSKTIPNYTTQLDLNNLNHFEQDFYKNYQNLITNYKSKFGEYLDLTGDLEPPTDIFIDVRCLKDGGDVTTEYGSFNLIKDSQFYVRKSDVERLIQQGYLEEL